MRIFDGLRFADPANSAERRRVVLSRDLVDGRDTAEVAGTVWRSIAAQYRTQILELCSRHHGNAHRVHEELIVHGAHVS
jgi:hypothetical protein